MIQKEVKSAKAENLTAYKKLLSVKTLGAIQFTNTFSTERIK